MAMANVIITNKRLNSHSVERAFSDTKSEALQNLQDEPTKNAMHLTSVPLVI